MHILAASPLSQALNKMTYESKRGLSHRITLTPGLSLNPSPRNILKDVRFLLENKKSLRNGTELLLSHDNFKKTTAKQRSNDFKHCGPDNLVYSLQQIRFRVETIEYCTRMGAHGIVNSLLNTGILVIQVTKNLISPQKQLDY